MKTPKSLYSRLALITSVTLVVGYFVVYAAWTTINPVNTGDILSKALVNNILSNLSDLDTRVTDLSASSIWSKVGNDINYTAGKVGIGTTSPNKDLHIYNTTTNAELDLQSTATAGSHWGIYHNSPDQSLRFWHSGVTDAMTILPSGNVGIGTVSPSSAIGSNKVLEISGTYGGLALSSTVPSANKVEIGNFGYNTMIFATNSAERMRIDGAGNVGIGTVSPSAKLDVNGNINSTPILARWNIELPYQAANTNLNWNSELINTNPAYIQRNASGTGINILVAGYYQVNVKVLQYSMCDACRGDVYLRYNGVSIGSMIGYGGPSPQQFFYHSFSNLYYFNAGAVITIYSEGYPVHPGSSLEIVKLN